MKPGLALFRVAVLALMAAPGADASSRTRAGTGMEAAAATAPVPATAPAVPPAAIPPEAAALGLSERGAGDYRHFGFLVYQARLWAGPGFQVGRYAEHPLLLEVRYARSLRGTAIAERSLDEMRRQGPVGDAQAARWLADLQRAFPDVTPGDRLSGLQRPGQPTRFFLNGRPVADWEDAELSRRFFGIWLAPQTSAPRLREALAGGGVPP